MLIDRFDYLIIGNSTAAIGAIEAIRSKDTDGRIGVVAHEFEHTYSRPLITYFMSGKVPEDKVYYRPEDFYDRYNIERIFGRQVNGISTDDNAVILEDGSRIGYGMLLIAAGGSPISMNVPGVDRPGVFFMNTMDDARRAKGWLAHARRAVVVGAGLTGLKTAEALVELGQEVTVVELAPRVLVTTLDTVASDIVREVMVKNGVDVLTGVQVTSIDGADDTNDVASAVLSTGERIACDSLFVTIGIRPRIEIVNGSDIRVGRGILVDRHMQTNIPNVYAAGDIAEAYDPIMGSSRVLPILPNAYIGGRVAGLNMVGVESLYNLGMSVNSVSFFGYPVMSAGLAAQEEDDFHRVVSIRRGCEYKKFVIKDGKLVGMIVCGDVNRAGIITGLMRAGVNVDGSEQKLLEGGLGLIDLPKDVLAERILSGGRNWF